MGLVSGGELKAGRGRSDSSAAWYVGNLYGELSGNINVNYFPQSDHFCGTCNRLRITADGNLKVSLSFSAFVVDSADPRVLATFAGVLV